MGQWEFRIVLVETTNRDDLIDLFVKVFAYHPKNRITLDEIENLEWYSKVESYNNNTQHYILKNLMNNMDTTGYA